MPTKSACNYPACTNCAKLSEPQLVGGKGSTCGGCRTARYCCVEHQHAHWKQHKTACKALAGTAGTSSSSSSQNKKKKGKV